MSSKEASTFVEHELLIKCEVNDGYNNNNYNNINNNSSGGGLFQCEPCLICLSQNTGGIQSWKQFWKPGEPLSLSRNVSCIFLLRNLLQYPKSEVARLLHQTCGVDPGLWCRLCEECGELVSNAYQLHQECSKLQEEIGRIGKVLRTGLQISLLESDGLLEEEEEDNARGLLTLHSVIREAFPGYSKYAGNERRDLFGSASTSYSSPPCTATAATAGGTDERSCQTDVDIPRLQSENERNASRLHLDKERRSTSPPPPRPPPPSAPTNIVFVKNPHLLVERASAKHGTSRKPNNKGGGRKRGRPRKSNRATKPSRKLVEAGSQTGSLETPPAAVPETPVRRGPGRPPKSSKFPKPSSSSSSSSKLAEKNGKGAGEMRARAKPGPKPKPKNHQQEVQTPGTSKTGRIGKFECSICHQVYHKLEMLNKHKEAHSIHTKFVCPICSYPSKCQSGRIRHLQRDHPKASLRCGECEFKTDSAFTYYKHEKDHKFKGALEEVVENRESSGGGGSSGGVLLHRCKFCGQTGKRLKMYRHMQSEHLSQLGLESFPCDTCDKVFSRKFELSRHLESIHGRMVAGDGRKQQLVTTAPAPRARNFQCDLCLTKFFHGRDLRSHLSSVHSGGKAVECKVCQLQFDHRTLLHAHLRTEHAELYTFKCDNCDMMFESQAVLSTHERSHSTETAECEHCGLKVKSASHLVEHLRKSCKEVPPRQKSGSSSSTATTATATTATSSTDSKMDDVNRATEETETSN